MTDEGTTLRWSAYEHEHIERGSDWFWALAIIAVSAALTSVLFHDFLFALLILLAAGILGMLAKTPPDLMEFELSNDGIRIGDTLHSFGETRSFWVEEKQSSHPILLLQVNKVMASHFTIPLHGVDPQAVRLFLREHVDEVPMREPFAHKLLEFFGL